MGERGEAFTLRMAHVNVGKMHTLERIGRWFVRPARMMLSRGSGQAPEKLSLIVAVVRGLELAHSPRDRGLGARGARGGTGGVSQSRPIRLPSST